MFFTKSSCPQIPADVPQALQKEFCKNYTTITKHKNRLFMLAYDQKMEHLNKDFYGPDISPDALHPEHIFKIADSGTIGALATNLGLIARYGKQYPNIPYIAKLNGKTDLLSTKQQDPLSTQLWSVDDAIALKNNSAINICGVGFTIYLGSMHEQEMLAQAAQVVSKAHKNGLIAILWIYLRGAHIPRDQDPMITSGLGGLAATLGADFVKIKPPLDGDGKTSVQWLSIASQAAGNTHIICAGGSKTDPEQFLNLLHQHIHQGHIAGCATGRNVFQQALPQAIAMTNAISAIVYKDKNVADAYKIYQSAKKNV
ncbi:MAG: hypothetical protein P4L31_01815 [Candidatus Babeliales bacterium]|nr:hypothetical protein [Candidatus Babeliales bacterium]